jgi:GDSL-like Lipase/Acylhydrolase family
MAALIMPRRRVQPWSNALTPALAVPRAMTTPPTVTTGAVRTLKGYHGLATYWSGNIGTLPGSVQRGPVAFSGGLPFGLQSALTGAATITAVNGPSPNIAGAWQLGFWHEGQAIELHVQSGDNAGAVGTLVRVDGEFTTLTPQLLANGQYVKYDFGSAKRRRIDLLTNANLHAIGVGHQSDAIQAAEVRGPRVICVGDSLTGTKPGGWPTWFAHAMGWDDVWYSGVGGTGYSTPGGGKKFRDRILTDVVAFAPDIVIFLGSRNDYSLSPTTVGADALAAYQAVRSALPDALIIAGANISGGVETLLANAWNVIEAMKTACESVGGLWLNPVDQPLGYYGGTVPATVLTAARSVGTAGYPTSGGSANDPGVFVDGNCIYCENAGGKMLRIGSTVEIGTGATRERVRITSASFGAYGFDGSLQYAHASGEPVREVGPCLFTGRGWTGAPSNTGWGNAAAAIGSDGVHLTDAGSRLYGMCMAQMVRHALGMRR